MGFQIVAGPSNTVVIDKQRMYWMAGKVCRRTVGSCSATYYTFLTTMQWKNSGEGKFEYHALLSDQLTLS